MIETLTGIESQQVLINNPDDLSLYAIREDGKGSQVKEIDSDFKTKPRNVGGDGPIDIYVECRVPAGTKALELRKGTSIVYRVGVNPPTDKEQRLTARFAVAIASTVEMA